MIPNLRGLAILDNDGRSRQPHEGGGLQIVYWQRYEAENYFITPDVLRRFAQHEFGDMTLFGGFREPINAVLDELILERVFKGIASNFATYRSSPPEAARLVWDAKTERLKLSDFAEEFFRRLSVRLETSMLLTKGELHRLVAWADPRSIPGEVAEKLSLVEQLFQSSDRQEDAAMVVRPV